MNRDIFEEYIIEKSDEIDGSAYALLAALLRTDASQENESLLPWDMAVIAPVIEAAKSELYRQGKAYCHPYYEDEIPCPLTGGCIKADCPHKTNKEA